MAITASVLAVVAVSTERFLAIVRPLQYKVGRCSQITETLCEGMTLNCNCYPPGKTYE